MVDKPLLKLRLPASNTPLLVALYVPKKTIIIAVLATPLLWGELGEHSNHSLPMSNIPIILGIQFYAALFTFVLLLLGCKSIEIQEIKNDAKLILKTPNLIP
jgi:hypothetical protein